jgi:hypothetical protein
MTLFLISCACWSREFIPQHSLHYEWCYKKTKTHKTKSIESILLQQNHRSKNIIIGQKIKKTKQTKQLHIT